MCPKAKQACEWPHSQPAAENASFPCCWLPCRLKQQLYCLVQQLYCSCTALLDVHNLDDGRVPDAVQGHDRVTLRMRFRICVCCLQRVLQVRIIRACYHTQDSLSLAAMFKRSHCTATLTNNQRSPPLRSSACAWRAQWQQPGSHQWCQCQWPCNKGWTRYER